MRGDLLQELSSRTMRGLGVRETSMAPQEIRVFPQTNFRLKFGICLKRESVTLWSEDLKSAKHTS